MKLARRIKYIFVSFFVGVLAFLLWVVWPILGVIPGLFGSLETLVLFHNESERRPCGGFVTAYGYLDWDGVSFKNIYHFENNPVGLAPAPVDRFGKNLFLWDIGTSPTLSACSAESLAGFESVSGDSAERVVLVSFSVISDLVSILGGAEIEGVWVDSDSFFAYLSRLVSDVDRHDEEALATRKSPLSNMGKGLVWETLKSPHLWRSMTNSVRQNLEDHDLWISGVSADLGPEASDWYLEEWNLGGAKSSRYLDKNISIYARQKPDLTFDVEYDLSVRHTGNGFDEPLSQAYRGAFWFYGDSKVSRKWDVEIAPGGYWEQSWIRTNVSLSEIQSKSFFVSRSDTVDVDYLVSLWPQQSAYSDSLLVKEGVLAFDQRIKAGNHDLHFFVEPDTTPPFVTFHERVECLDGKLEDNSNEDVSFFCVELHFSEVVEFRKFGAELVDKNYKNADTQVFSFRTVEFLPDNRSILLKFESAAEPPLEERFSVRVSGVYDVFKNQLKPEFRTVIWR